MCAVSAEQFAAPKQQVDLARLGVFIASLTPDQRQEVREHTACVVARIRGASPEAADLFVRFVVAAAGDAIP